MKHNLIAIGAGLVVALSAQTLIKENQIRKPLAPADSLLIQTPNGNIERVQIGVGLAIDKSVSPWKLVATQAIQLSTIQLSSAVPLRTFTVPAGKTVVMVNKNGASMAPGLDYTVNGTAVTFTVGQDSDPTDIVTALVY